MNIQIKEQQIVFSTIELKGKYYNLYNKYFRIKEDKLMYLDMDENKVAMLYGSSNMFSYFIKRIEEDGVVISEDEFNNHLLVFMNRLNETI